jgi:hypothetical protein
MVVVGPPLDTEEPELFFFGLRLFDGWDETATSLPSDTDAAAAATTGGDGCGLGNGLPSGASLVGSDLESCQTDVVTKSFGTERLSWEAFGEAETRSTCVAGSSLEFGRF